MLYDKGSQNNSGNPLGQQNIVCSGQSQVTEEQHKNANPVDDQDRDSEETFSVDEDLDNEEEFQDEK